MLSVTCLKSNREGGRRADFSGLAVAESEIDILLELT